MIRLLNAHTATLPTPQEQRAQQTSPYIIISHQWSSDPTLEVTFADMPKFHTSLSNPSWSKSSSAQKLSGACATTLSWSKNRIQHVWLDTVCINKSDPSEMSQAINSMYRWYKNAEACFAYLADDSMTERSRGGKFTDSAWFTRGWTLQELVAPKEVVFFDRHWRMMGDKTSLAEELTGRTGIAREFLLGGRNVGQASVAQRMSWFAGRVTTVEEDTAYCLLGMFGVNMPLLYGEGRERAFRRLQEEVMRYSDDHSLFAWKSLPPVKEGAGAGKEMGLLASDPLWFAETGGYEHHPSRKTDRPFLMTNKGISITLYLQKYQDHFVASIDCKQDEGHVLGLYLRCLSSETQQYRRIKTDQLCRVLTSGRGEPQSIYVKMPDDV